MKINKNTVLSIILPIAIGIGLCYYTFRIHDYAGLKDKVIRSDGIGYYAYLPAIFIYKDLSLNFLKNKELVDSDAGSIIPYKEDKVVNKYSVGLAILQLPFFLLAYFLSFLFSQPIDGFNIIFHTCFLVANAVYFTIGLIFLGKILYHFKVNIWTALVTMMLFACGNSILHYITYDAYLSHAFSLSLMIMLVYYVFKFQENQKKSNLVILGLVFGLIVLLRPVNLLALLFFPVLFNDPKSLITSLRLIVQNILFLFVPFLLVISVQLIIWYLQTGDFLVYSYGNEKFIWGSHDLVFAFFSYQRGFFIYNPIWLLFIGYYLYNIREIRLSFISLMLALLILGFVLSSWHNPFYGTCLGYRALLEYQIFLFVPFLFLKQRSRKVELITKSIYTLAISLAICYTLVITIQYQQSIIPWDGPNKAQYWEVFGKTDNRYNFHFFYPEQQKNIPADTVHIYLNNKAILSDTGFTIYPKVLGGNVLTGVGFYADVTIRNPRFTTAIFDFYVGDSLISWEHKLISKDVKNSNSNQPFYIDDFIRNPGVNRINFRIINIKESDFVKITNERFILYYTSSDKTD